MGCGASGPLPAVAADAPFCSITYNWVDILRMIDCNDRVQLLVKKAAQHYWKPGVNALISNQGAMDMELKSRPFVRGANRKEMIESKRMSVGILEFMLADG